MSEPGDRIGAIGLDIGGTKIAVGLATRASSHLEHRATASTRAELGAGCVLESADALLREAVETADRKGIALVGLGISVPELVDTKGRIVSEAVVVGLGASDLGARYAGFGIVEVESDVRAAAIAEARFGAGRSFESFCYVNVGTGISHCLVQGGVPWSGSRGNAILIGSSVMAEWQEGEIPQRWVLEDIASGRALLADYRTLGGEASSVRDILDGYGTDQRATRAVDKAASALGIGLATLANLLDPESLVVGGGLGSAGGPYFELAVTSARNHIYLESARDIPVLQAALGEDSAVLGAAALVFDSAAGPHGKEGRPSNPRSQPGR